MGHLKVGSDFFSQTPNNSYNFIIDQCRQPAVVERNIAPEQHDLE
jgi:hypothetical protein